MQYILDKLTYSHWYRQRFNEAPDTQLTDADSRVILELDHTSKLSSPEEKVVHVHVVAGSVGVPIQMQFAVVKRCLVPYQIDNAIRRAESFLRRDAYGK